MEATRWRWHRSPVWPHTSQQPEEYSPIACKHGETLIRSYRHSESSKVIANETQLRKFLAFARKKNRNYSLGFPDAIHSVLVLNYRYKWEKTSKCKN